MKINEFLEHVSELFEDTDPSLITPHTEFKSLEEWSSLMALSLIAMVDEEYDIVLKGDDVRGCSTLEQLFNVIQTN